MAGMVKMTVMGRRVIPASPSPTTRLNATEVVTIEQKANTQLMANMEYVSARAGMERETLANMVSEWTSTVTGPLPGSYVKWPVVGTTSDVEPKSPGPELPTSKVMIGMDLFVGLSMAKTEAEKEYRSSGAKN